MPRICCTMADRRYAAFNYSEGCNTESKRTMTFERRYNAANFRIPFRINWTIILTIIVSISVCQFAVSVAERHASSSHGKKHYDQLCSVHSARRSMAPSQTSQNVTEDPALTPQDVLSRLEAAAVLRDNLVAMLGRVLLLCLNDNVRVPFEQIYDAVRNYRVAVYEFLPIVPALRNKLPKQQLYRLLQMLERVDNRFVSEYASLCIIAFPDIDAALEQVPLADMLLDIDQEVIESVSHDKRKAGVVPSSLMKDIDFLLQAARDGDQILNLRTVSAILLNYPAFDLTDPEVPNAIRFIAQRLKERSGSEADALLQYMGRNLENATNFLKTVLERLEADELSSEIIRETTSLLLQNFNVVPYPPVLNQKDNLKKLFMMANDYYPPNVAAVAKYLFDHLNDSHLQDLDIGFYETGDHALLQILLRLRRKSHLHHLRKPLSLLIPFVTQKLVSDANYDYTMPISFYEVNNYLDSFDTPCLQQNISDAMNMLRLHLSEDLPWTYAFGNRRMSDDPWELMLTSLIRLRNVPVDKSQANVIDDFIYKGRVNGLTPKRGLLYDSGIIFQRDDSTEVEVDFFSLLKRIPNAFKSEKFAPMLNFMSKPDILNILDFEFNKFEHETPRNLLLAMLKRALTLPIVKSDKSLSKSLHNAHNYLEEPLLINLYTSKDLQLLLNYLPFINSEPRYLPLKILFKGHTLFAYLSTTFSLADAHTPMEGLLLILQTVGLKTTQPKLSEALSFAIDNINGPPLPIRAFDRSDFVYLVQQLLSRNKTLQDEILKSNVYMNVSDWNVSISGTPENILARTLNYPIYYVSSNANLFDLVKQAEDILEEEILINTEILKKQTLEAMLEYLPSSTYVKPVILLVRKANLMTLVPKLNLAILEKATPRDALIMLLKNLMESRIIRAEKLLLRRVRAALSSLDDTNEDDRQTPIFAYLVQSLQDPSNTIYQPLLLKISKDNSTILPEERQAWLQNYFQQIIDKNKSKDKTRAASMILREITYNESLDETSRASKERIDNALSFLPTDSFIEPLRKLLTPDWTYSILPEEIRNSDSLEKEELLLAILHYAKQRPDVADNPSLMKAITKMEAGLKGWGTNVESLRSVVDSVKAAVYDPVKKLLSAAELNKIQITVPSGRSAKISLLGLLHRLLQRPLIKKNDKVFKLLNDVRQDVLDFGIDVDLLTVLNDVGIPYINELAPIRLYLHREGIDEKLGQTIVAIANPKKRYRTLLHVLQNQYEMNKDTQFYNALSTLKNIQPGKGKTKGTMISDLEDILNTIPHRLRRQFKPIEHLFNANTLSHLTNDNEIVESKTPLITLLSRIMDLPEVSRNHTVANKLNKLLSDVDDLSYPIVTGFQLRPLLQELEHVQQINVDYLNSILNSEILSYLNTQEFFDASNDNVEMLKNIVDYLLREGLAFEDYNMQKHLQSFKRALELTVGSSKASKRDLTKEDLEKMLVLIPNKKDFRPIKIFLQTGEIFKYIKHKNTDWKKFSTPAKKLLHLLSLLESNEINNDNVYKSAKKLQHYLEKRYNFITEQDVKSMHHTLASLKLYDVVSLKIFLNHDNMIKYLPPDFKYTSYSSPIDALGAVLDNMLQVSSLKHKVTLYKTMKFVRQACREHTQSSRRALILKQKFSSEDLEFVNLFNMSLPQIREFLKPEKLVNLLPKSFTFDNQPTFKMKMLHLLRQLLKLDTNVHSELEGLLREGEMYPDIPDITEDNLVPLLNVFPVEGIPYLELVKNYLKPSMLIKLLPGNYIVRQASTARVALYDILMMLSITLGSTTNGNLKLALDTLLRELTKVSSDIIPYESSVDGNDIRSIVKEIPFKQYKQIQQLESQMKTKKIILSLPLNFQLTDYKTKKLRVLAVLDKLSKSNAFQSLVDSINFAKRIVSKMPDMPMVNDTEIERLLLRLPMDPTYVQLLVKNCNLTTLMPYLPIYFNLSSIESRKMKATKILHYCKVADLPDVSTGQALITAEAVLKKLPDFDVTRDHVEVLIRAIPCTHFTSIKPLLRFLSKMDIASLIPWQLDLYQKSRTFRQRLFDLLTALRNVKELQNNDMFSALDSLETNAKSLPQQVNIPKDIITVLNGSQTVATAPCSKYRDFVLKTENLIQILPPNFRFQGNGNNRSSIIRHSEWLILMRFSALFLRDMKIDGPMKNAFEACRDDIHKVEKMMISDYLWRALNSTSFEQLVPLRLYMLGHKEDITVPDVYHAFPFGSIFSILRVVMREFISGPKFIKSKSLLNDMEVFLHDYLMTTYRVWSINNKSPPETYSEVPSLYEINRAIGEIPSDNKYDDLRLLMQCQDIEEQMMAKTLQSEDTPKQLLLQMLELAENGNIDNVILESIKTFKSHLVNDIHAEEVEYALKQMRDYRYHASKVNVIRKYFVLWGFEHILGHDFSKIYPTYKNRLFAINDVMLNYTINRPTEFSAEYRTASDDLNSTLHNEIKIEHIMPRTMDDINVQSLFFALPKTRDEKIIRGVIKFFSVPNLLRKLKLPKDPFEYVTKGQLLRAIMDLGQQLKSVQQDSVQQEALEYFRDKIITDGPGAQPIELKKYARDSNVDVDLYGVMRAIDYEKINKTDAVKVATFFERKYNNLVHAVGFDHMAYATRGSYLKALFEHLVNVSEVPDDVKQQITSLIPAVKLDGPGEENVDLNTDIVYEKTPSRRMLEEFLNDKSQSFKPHARLGMEMSQIFQENKELLNAVIDNMLETISSAEEEHLEYIDKRSNNVSNVSEEKFEDHIVINSSQHLHSARQKSSEQSRMQDTSKSSEVLATNYAKKKNDQSLLSDINVLSNEAHIEYNIEDEAGHISKSNINWQIHSSSSDDLNDDDKNSLIFEERVESSPVSSQKLLSKKLPKKSHHPHRTRHKTKNRRLLIQPDTTFDIEYVGSDENAPIDRILHHTLQNEKSLSLTEELIAKHAKLIARMSKTVTKGISSKENRKNMKDSSR